MKCDDDITGGKAAPPPTPASREAGPAGASPPSTAGHAPTQGLLATGRCELWADPGGAFKLVMHFNAEAGATFASLANGLRAEITRSDVLSRTLLGIEREMKRMRRENREVRQAQSVVERAPSVTQGEAERVMKLVRLLNDGPNPRKLRLQEVFQQVVLEGRTQAHVASLYSCSRALVALRVKEIERRMQHPVEVLRAYALQLGQATPTAPDGREERADTPEPEEGEETEWADPD
jgi:hypothetical protein